ncbi:MAG TPA: histidine phosphatase family protein [Gemmatimonadota bacterium]|nr:histidine phosphatase family protein [Gemmatimonadota bacterium]
MSAEVPGGESRVVLVRHGETEYNFEGRWQGSGSDVPLNATGRVQAGRVAEALAARFDAALETIYSSDLARAFETAEILAARLGIAIVEVPALRELSHGAWEGRTQAEVEARWPAEYAAYLANPFRIGRGGGESYADLERRVWPALERLAGVHRGQRIVAVSHGGPIRLALSRILDRPLADRDALGVVNGSWFEISRSSAGWSLESSGLDVGGLPLRT